MEQKTASDASGQTREKLLAAAERLVISEGVHALTVRRIAREADANSALIRYHFGNTDGLLLELARRNAARLNDLRNQLLDAIDAREQPDFEASVDALVLPLWASAAMSQDQRALVVLDEIFSRADETLQREVWAMFSEGVQRVNQAIAACLPGISLTELAWRVRFVTAAALDVPPRSNRAKGDALAAPDAYRAIYGRDDLPERLGHFRVFAQQALRHLG
jgi:AcrR family transcriptional regulator